MNFVDWLLLALAVISVGVFVYFAFFSELQLFSKREENVSFEYTVTVENVNANILLGLADRDLPESRTELKTDFISVGDKVYSCEDGALIGRVTAVAYERSVEPTEAKDENGNLIYADYYGHVDIIITVKGEGVSENGVFSINGYELRVGSDIEFRTPKYTALGEIVNVSGKEA